MLTLTRRGLERDGFVRRHYFPEVPPRVEYQLSDLGTGMLTSLQDLDFKLRNNFSHIEKNRRV